MLKKIRVDEVRLGMHLHELCGAWIDHPFWKTRFVLSDPQDLEKLRANGVVECWIDAAKGLDVPAPLPSSPQAPSPAPATPPRTAADAPTRSSMAEETVRAAALIGQAKKAVQTLLGEARMG